MNMNEIKSEVRSFLGRGFRIHEIEDDSNIFEIGIVNSLFFVQLLIFIEKKFKIELQEGEFDITRLNSVNLISKIISDKIGGSLNE
ncbi:phosphopantetheine-binding protein [Marinomonas sp. TI.3.20]|uniref:acyl carrier protein n=1 Tax=Marinomonas sp. TI.3.20 TaxID=3121296 RepID=UPI0031201C2D